MPTLGSKRQKLNPVYTTKMQPDFYTTKFTKIAAV